MNKLLSNYFKKKTRRLKVDATQFSVFSRLLVFFVYLTGIFLALGTLPQFKTLSLSFFASAGIIAAIVGFASQKAFSNIISGIVIASNEPFRVGDLIKVDDFLGIVEDITLWHTIVKDFENRRIIFPNSKISDATVENYNIFDNRVCKFIEFNIAYDADVEKAIEIMKEEILRHPLFFDNRTDEEKAQGVSALNVKLIGFTDSSVVLRAWAWTKDPMSSYLLQWDMFRKIKARFEKEGIEIPYPHRTILYKKDIDENMGKDRSSGTVRKKTRSQKKKKKKR
jgi:small-conductance mechanosensitive channel